MTVKNNFIKLPHVLTSLCFLFTPIAKALNQQPDVSNRPLDFTNNSTTQIAVEKKLYHSGGVVNEFELCPKTPFDTITPISSLNPAPQAGTPEMSITGVNKFIKKNNITSIDDLLNTFPDHYRTNFSLVEHTRATGQSNLEYPRIVLFGSDGRFLLNVGTKPDDPLYNKLDVAELNTQTGHWEFSVFDFTSKTPTLTRNDPSCNECHGSTNSRPVWGAFQQWTGVFGDSIIDGPRPEALDHTHAERMNRLIFSKSKTPRFNFLHWKKAAMHRGGFREIANHDFGPELLLSNIAMGSATSLGSFLRLTQKYPNQYKDMRKALLLAYYKKRTSANRYFVKVNHSKKMFNYTYQKKLEVTAQLAKYQSTKPETHEPTLDDMLTQLGLDPKEAFSLSTLHETEAPKTDWGMAAADLYDLLMLQILDDLRKSDPMVNKILTKAQPEYGVFECPDTASSIGDLVDFKMLHLFQLSGSARYQVNWVYYPKDLEDIYDQIFLPVSSELIDYLASTNANPDGEKSEKNTIQTAGAF